MWDRGPQLVALAGWLVWLAGCPSRLPSVADAPQRVARPSAEAELRDLIRIHVGRLAPLARELNLAYWRAVSEGDRAARQRQLELEAAIRRLHAEPADLARLRRWADSGQVRDGPLGRQLELLRADFEAGQLPAGLAELLARRSVALEQRLADHRFELAGRPVDEAELYGLLAGEPDEAVRRAAWRALLGRGAAVGEQLRELVRLRNQAARALGAPDYFSLSLRQAELEPAWLESLLEELARGTDALHADCLERLRNRLAERYGLEPDGLQAWHLDDPFFQRLPVAAGLDLEPLFAAHEPRLLARTTFARLGLDAGPILARAQLAPRPGRRAQALCLDVDRAGDVRILADLRPGERWTSTLLHELGHGLFSTQLAPELPWLLRRPAHPAVSEAVASLLGDLTRDEAWLRDVLGVAAGRLELGRDGLRRSRLDDRLIFVRFCLLMIHFERELYRDPEQDLDRLWWRLRERYQGLAGPAGPEQGDWAAKGHLVFAPVYFHNYLLAELIASQLRARLADGARGSWLAEASGRFLLERIIAPGASLRWDALLEAALGRPLEAQALLAELSGERPAREER